ncbi:hypothetical protein WA026_015305 [Henosepilachna vigintioctopunctata]|uniref:Homologous recombination OB-fold protein OB-fold domain-containing protein n=1 Tax=Henosepilachna vigintioctopunctata TaxID=420089 RepID=A0AAW1TVD7_9CUCU
MIICYNISTYSQSSSSTLKRPSTEPIIEEQNKRSKILPHTDDINENISISNLKKAPLSDPLISPSLTRTNSESKKTFKFKKTKTTLVDSSLINSFELKVSNDVSHSTGHMHQNTNNEIPIQNQLNGININTEKESSVKIHSKKNNTSHANITKRRFPGPAGLLPERYSENFNLGESDKINFSGTKDEICSQRSCLVLNEGPWQKMRIEFQPKSPEEIYLPDKYNIQWIKTRTTMKKLINQKAPFLAAFIHSINSHSIQNPIVNLTLKDKTGTIQGTILHKLYEEYCNELTVGSVIVLKEIGVLDTGSKNEPYLTITSNNLISIYPTACKFGSTTDILEKELYKINVQNISASELCNNIKESNRLHKEEIMNLKNKQTSPLLSNESIAPLNISHNFRKAVSNLNNKPYNTQLQPNLNNLKTNLALKNKSNNTFKKIESNILNQNGLKLVHKNSTNKPPDNCKITENITDIMDLFNTQEGLDEFFNEEPNFCSTQIRCIEEANTNSTENTSGTGKMNCNNAEVKDEILKDSEKENRSILADMLDGLDTDALFNDF